MYRPAPTYALWWIQILRFCINWIDTRYVGLRKDLLSYSGSSEQFLGCIVVSVPNLFLFGLFFIFPWQRYSELGVNHLQLSFCFEVNSNAHVLGRLTQSITKKKNRKMTYRPAKNSTAHRGARLGTIT